MDKKQEHKDQENKEPEAKAEKKPLERYGCIPAQTLDEIRKEIQDKYPGTTIEELESMGC